MSRQIAPPTPEINRLRAAAALIPLIEAGLADSKLSPERASLMVAFCEWTTESNFDEPEAVKLATKVRDGLERLKVALSVSAMDLKQVCWRDNVFVERLWKSVKYEEVYLHGYETVSAARQALARYFDFYNRRRPHSMLDGKTPDMAYFNLTKPPLAAAA